MAGTRPFFITGANAKVKLNGKTLAFCTDLSYSVQVAHQTPKVLGMYEGTSVEPLGYTVSGSFTVIRYTKDAKSGIGANNLPVAANDAGNGVGNWGTVWGSGLGSHLAAAGIGNDGRANEALDPSKFQNATTFDIQVYQQVPNTVDNGASAAASIAGFLQGQVNNSTNGKLLGVANIRNCRITKADFSVNKKGTAMQRFEFVALYVDEDSFVADFSGSGQQFNQ